MEQVAPGVLVIDAINRGNTIDLVAEGRCWFEERGSRPLKVAIPAV